MVNLRQLAEGNKFAFAGLKLKAMIGIVLSSISSIDQNAAYFRVFLITLGLYLVGNSEVPNELKTFGLCAGFFV